VLHMDPCKAINVGISVSHVVLGTVAWGLLSHHTTILLLLSVPRAHGTVGDNRDRLGVLGLLLIFPGVGGVSGLARSVDGGVLPAHELPVEFLAPAESIPKADGSSVVAKNLRRQATSLWHAVLEDDAPDTGVDERH
jgi:hypothetical protein